MTGWHTDSNSAALDTDAVITGVVVPQGPGGCNGSPGDDHPYLLIEVRQSYNAAYLEKWDSSPWLCTSLRLNSPGGMSRELRSRGLRRENVLPGGIVGAEQRLRSDDAAGFR